MSQFGLKVHDTDGNYSTLTVKIGRILASERVSMPNSLEADNTYGVDVALDKYYDEHELGVIAYPVKFGYHASIAIGPDFSPSYPACWYADNNATYYTKNDTTGVMSGWSAGAMLQSVPNTWNGMASSFPVASWDYPVGQTQFNEVRIWAAMAYIVYDVSAADFKTVYSIGNEGVEEVDYMVFVRGTT